jgi:hypothetical protein
MWSVPKIENASMDYIQIGLPPSSWLHLPAIVKRTPYMDLEVPLRTCLASAKEDTD